MYVAALRQDRPMSGTDGETWAAPRRERRESEFLVSVRTPSLARLSGFGGRLRIAPGELVCVPGRVLKKVGQTGPTRHAATQVEVTTSWLVPPWFSVSLVVDPGVDEPVLAMTGLFARRRLVRALRDAGFEVHEISTALSRGRTWDDVRSG
jgi:hypothetical protein